MVTRGRRASRTLRGALWTALALLVVAGVGIIAFPTLYIRPFATQDPTVLGWALTARSAAPAVTGLAAILTTAVAVPVVLVTRRRSLRALAAVLVAPVVLAAWFARQNHFEWMFAPQTTVAHVDAAKATFVEPDDLVMAVTLDGAAVAYPIRQLAYHHVVNDVLAGTPIAATY